MNAQSHRGLDDLVVQSRKDLETSWRIIVGIKTTLRLLQAILTWVDKHFFNYYNAFLRINFRVWHFLHQHVFLTWDLSIIQQAFGNSLEINALIAHLNRSTLPHRHILAHKCTVMFSSVQFSSVTFVSYSVWPHEPQHPRPPCPSPTPRVYPNSYPLSRWCHPTISCSVIPFSSCPQSFSMSGSFQMSQLFALGGQSIGVSAPTSVLPLNTQERSPLGWTGWISLQSKGLSKVFSTPQFKSINYSALSFLHNPTPTSIHDHWKNHSLD